jgi:hypothetical protein
MQAAMEQVKTNEKTNSKKIAKKNQKTSIIIYLYILCFYVSFI